MGAGPGDTPRGEGAVITTRGRTRLVIDDDPVSLRPRERSVLAAIAATHPRPALLDEVIDRVWGNDAPEHARNSLHNHIGRIRRAAPDVVRTADDGYGLVDGVDVDHVGGEAGDTPLGDLADTDDVAALRLRIDERFAVEVEDRVRTALAKPTAESLAEAHHLAQTHPDRERHWHLLAATQAALGQRRDALTSIRSARRALADFGLEIGVELAAFEAQLLAGNSTTSTRLSGPTRVHPHSDDPFIGRGAELHDLQVTWADVLDRNSPRLAIVRGPAGIGKTRLVDEFVLRATETGTTPPRITVSRERLDDDRPLGALTDVIGSSVVAITSTSDSDVGLDLQRRVDAAIASMAEMPTIWIIDDLQWTPTDSLRLLTHAIEAAHGPLLLITTHRTGELTAPGLLDRRVATTTVELAPMARNELEELIIAWSIPLGPGGDLDLLHSRTAGLPMFASEVARVASRRGGRIDPESIPPALNDWVRHRLDELDAQTTDVLQTASAVGAEFDVDTVADSTKVDVDSVDQILDDLVTRGVVATTDRPGELQFAHVLVRDVVYDALGPAQARRLHARVASAIATRPNTERLTEWHAALALHLHRGGGSERQVRTHAIEACDGQLRAGAWSAAAQSIGVALDTHPDDAERAELLARRGRVLLRLQRFEEASVCLYDTIDIARRLHLPTVRGRATLDLVGRAGRGAAVEASDEERLSLLRSAIEALDVEGTVDDDVIELRSELERELAFAHLLTGEEQERIRLLETSLARIESLSPPRPRALAWAVLGMRYARLSPDQLDARLTDIDRVLAMNHRDIGPETTIAAHVYRIEEWLRAGDARRARQSADDAADVLSNYPEPYWAWANAAWRGVLALHDGDLDAAEHLAFEAMALGRNSAGATACLGVNLTNIRLLQGRVGEMLDLLSTAVDEHPEIPAYRAVLALCAAEGGDANLAQRCIDWFSEAGFANLPRDTSRSLALAVLAHASAEVDDADAARMLLPLVEPYVGQQTVITVYGGGGAIWGPASHALARLAATTGDAGRAASWFELAMKESVDAPLFAARVARHLDATAVDA